MITYEDIREPMVSVTIARSAVVEPIFISDRRLVTAKETITALSGIFHPGVTYSVSFSFRKIRHCEGALTYPKNPENGRPRSRAKDQSWREAVAISVMELAVRVRTITAVMVLVPGRLSVAL